MADTNYVPKIYHKQDGEKLVVASGGQIVIEDGGSFSFFDTDSVTASQLRALARGYNVLTVTNASTASTVLSDMAGGGSSPPVFPSTYGIFLLSCGSGMINGSARMYSGLAGQRVHVRFTHAGLGSVGSIIVMFSGAGFTGVQCIGSAKSEISSISLQQSAASSGWITLFCIKDGVWSVEDSGGLVTERATT